MWGFTTLVFLVILQTYYAARSGNVIEPHRENCTDLNAERRLDNSSCVVTCKKKALTQNPKFCFGKPKLQEGCYCKDGYYLDETIKKCVRSEKCSCNVTANEISRFGNECGNNCETFHTLTPCPNPLTSQCWCHTFYCKNKNGTCILKETFYDKF